MAEESKKIGNPIELRLLYYITPNGQTIEYAKACYTVRATEYDISEARMILLQHTQELQNCTKDFAEEAVRQVELHEGIEAEDSLLNVNPPA